MKSDYAAGETGMAPAFLKLAACSTILAALAGPACAKTLKVGSGSPFASISVAVSNAQKGDVIEVGSGTYPEAVTVQRAVTIRGVDTGGGLPVITPRGGSFAFRLTGGGAVLENLVITGSQTPEPAPTIQAMVRKDAGILVESSGNTLRSVSVRKMQNGLLVFGDGNKVHDSAFAENAVVGAGVRSGGRNSFTNSAFADNGLYGLMLGWFNDPALAAGDMQEWFKVLRTLKKVEYNKVSDNRFSGNGWAGLILGQAAFDNEVRANTATGNGGTIPPEIKVWSKGAGIYLSCGPMRNTIASNDVRNNDNSGITIDPGLDNIFRENRIADNTALGISMSASTGNRFESNAVSGHKDYGIVLRRWVKDQMPNASNLLTGNILKRNGVNAYDDSGVTFAPPPQVRFVDDAARRRALSTYSVANKWDDGARGNHYDDFDEASEGFRDADGDGIGEVSRPIPGGAAVDHKPLARTAIEGGGAPVSANMKVAEVETLCVPFGPCNANSNSCGPQ